MLAALNEKRVLNLASEKDWIDILSALLTPFIAFSAIGIAVLQWKINRNRLKHELFDRRYKQYQAVSDFMGSILREGKATEEAQRVYLNGVVGMEFTFSKDIANYLHKNVWCPAIELECAQAEFDGLPVSDERSRLVHKAGDLKKQIHAEFNKIDSVFRTYLELSH